MTNDTQTDEERIECSKTVSDDGLRSALGRNVKLAGLNHTYDIVRAYTLKERVGGRWSRVDSGVSDHVAADWVGKDVS